MFLGIKKYIAMLTLFMFVGNIFWQGAVYAVDEVTKNIEKSKASKKLDKVEKIVVKVAEKIKNRTNDVEIKNQLDNKKEEIKKLTQKAKQEIEKASSKEEIKKIENKTKKLVVLKLVNWITKKENVKEKVEEKVKTPKEYYEALKVMKKMFDKWYDYELIVKTKYSEKKFVWLLKKFAENIAYTYLYDGKNGYKYYQVKIPKESTFAQEMLAKAENFELPKSFLWKKIVSPTKYKVEEEKALKQIKN